MPTITRFLGFLLALAALAMAAVLALAHLVQPETRTFSVPIDPSVLAGARPLTPPPAVVEPADAAPSDEAPDETPDEAAGGQR